MRGLLASVRREFDPKCMVWGRPNKRGCSASLEGAPQSRIVIDLDKPSSPLSGNKTRCDYLVFAEESGDKDWFTPLELKKGGLRPSKVVAQLQAGADAAFEAVGSHLVNFLPVAAVGRIHRVDRTKLKEPSNMVQFGTQRKTVQVMGCGGKLVDALKWGRR